MMSQETQVLTAAGERVGDAVLGECTLIKSALMEELRVGEQRTKGITVTKNLLRMAFILAHPAGETRKLLLGGTAAIEVAVDEWADQFSVPQGKELLAAIQRIMERATLWGAEENGDHEKNLPATDGSPHSPRSPQ